MYYQTQYICNERIFEKQCPLNYASVGTFCSRIGQLFESYWFFEDSVKSDILYRFRIKIDVKANTLWSSRAKCVSSDCLIYTQKVSNAFVMVFENILLNVNFRPSNIRSLHYAKTWIYLTPYWVLNEILTADRSCTTKYSWKTSYRSW